jgi:hypothetical protein
VGNAIGCDPQYDPTPAPDDPGIDCPDLPEEDAGPDAGAGGKDDDGCGCSAAGSSTMRGLLVLVLTVLVG